MFSMTRSRMLKQHKAGLNNSTALPEIPDLKITYHQRNELKPNPKNPRQHTRRQLKLLAKNMKQVGFVIPIIVDAQLMVICGHGRLEAGGLAGISRIPTVQLSHLSDAQAKGLMIADNRLTDLSTFSEGKLGELFIELSASELNFDLETTAFTTGQIDVLLEQLDGHSVPQTDPADVVPELSKHPVSKLNDLWCMGEHRVLCGDAREESSYRTLMAGQLASMILTDPPYNLKIEGTVSGKGKIKHGDFAMAAGEMTEAEFIAFLTQVFQLLAVFSTNGSLHYVFTDWRHLFEFLSAGRAAYTELKHVADWIKSNGGMGSLYRNRIEHILIFKHGTAPHRNNIELGRNGRNRTNVFEYPNASFFGKSGEEGDIRALHPTPKPPRLLADAMMDVSARGDIILDPFLGSGATVIAAERTSRRCYGLEIDPLFTDVIVRRWQAWTGEHAVHAVTGRKFDDVAAEVTNV